MGSVARKKKKTRFELTQKNQIAETAALNKNCTLILCRLSFLIFRFLVFFHYFHYKAHTYTYIAL